jgi:hypothetical protein
MIEDNFAFVRRRARSLERMLEDVLKVRKGIN